MRWGRRGRRPVRNDESAMGLENSSGSTIADVVSHRVNRGWHCGEGGEVLWWAQFGAGRRGLENGSGATQHPVLATNVDSRVITGTTGDVTTTIRGLLMRHAQRRLSHRSFGISSTRKPGTRQGETDRGRTLVPKGNTLVRASAHVSTLSLAVCALRRYITPSSTLWRAIGTASRRYSC